MQYADYAAWQRRWMSGPWLAAEAGVLAGSSGRPAAGAPSAGGPAAPGGADLPRRPAAVQPAGRPLGDARRCRRRWITPYMLLLAAFETLLARCSREEDIAVGSPIAGRDHLEIEGLIGFFVNTLVMRGDLRGDPSFAELLERAREVTLTSYAHQEVPFEMLVGELQPQRSLSHSPLFQVMLAFQDAFAAADAPQALAGLTSLPFETGAGTGIAKVDLTLFVTLAGAAPRCALEYSSDLFDESTARRLAGHFTNLLAALVAEPERRIGGAPLLAAAERRQILVEWNDSAAAVPLDRAFPREFEAQAARTPHAVAAVSGGVRAELRGARTAGEPAGPLPGRQGAGPETVVALLAPRSVDLPGRACSPF